MNHEVDPEEFSDYLNSVVKLEELQKMTDSLDQELLDSQDALIKIKSMFNFLTNNEIAIVENLPSQPSSNSMLSEEVSEFLEADTPNLLLPDMTNNPMDLDDLSVIINQTKSVAEKLKTEYEQLASQTSGNQAEYTFTDLNLHQYVTSLADLNDRLTHIKIQKSEQIHNRNAELEEKLSELNENVHFFTKMIEAKEAFRECNENWKSAEQSNSSSQYEALINKLLADINEVTYLMKSKN